MRLDQAWFGGDNNRLYDETCEEAKQYRQTLDFHEAHRINAFLPACLGDERHILHLPTSVIRADATGQR